MSSSASAIQGLSRSERKCHACSYCGKIFTSRGRVRRHQVVHTGAKPFACSECGNKYSDQTALRRHEFLHRNETFECHHCKKTFRQFYCLSEHINKYHDGKREFACGECAKTLAIPKHMT
ncbi:Zinc finger protein 70 [Aphelenchoides avenae]|nr:Zinc finger protein 70 [Aphelenchus avenae]